MKYHVLADIPATLTMPDGTTRDVIIPAPKHSNDPFFITARQIDFQEDRDNDSMQRIKGKKYYEFIFTLSLRNFKADLTVFMLASFIDIELPVYLTTDSTYYQTYRVTVDTSEMDNRAPQGHYFKALSADIDESNLTGIAEQTLEFRSKRFTWAEFEQEKILLHPATLITDLNEPVLGHTALSYESDATASFIVDQPLEPAEFGIVEAVSYDIGNELLTLDWTHLEE